MILALELATGLLLCGALAAALGILSASALGRMITRDDEQREVGASIQPA